MATFTATERTSLLVALHVADLAAAGGSNDREIEALWALAQEVAELLDGSA